MFNASVWGGVFAYLGGLAILVIFASAMQKVAQGDFEVSFFGYLRTAFPKLLVFQVVCILAQFLFFLWSVCQGHLDPVQPKHVEANNTWLYFPHVGNCLALLIYFVSMIGWIAATWWLRDTQQEFLAKGIDFSQLIRQLNLNPGKPESEAGRAWAMSVPIQFWFEVLTAASLILIVLVGPISQWLPVSLINFLSGSGIVSTLSAWFESSTSVRAVAFLAIVCFVWFIVAGGHRFESLDNLTQSFRRTFSDGGMGIVSLSAIVIVICWIFGVSYVRTVMIGDRTIVFWYLLSCYTLYWCHEYWLRQAVNTATIAVFSSPPPPPTKLHDAKLLAAYTSSASLTELNRSTTANDRKELQKASEKVQLYRRANTCRVYYEPGWFKQLATDSNPLSQSDSNYRSTPEIGSKSSTPNQPPPERFREVRIYGAAQLAIYEGSNGDAAPEFKRAYEPLALFSALIDQIVDHGTNLEARELKKQFAGRRLWHFITMNAAAIGLFFGFFLIIFFAVIVNQIYILR
ncbi:MAG: hypothetical protein U0930_11615 [Pirellulales bacterium]